MEIFVASLLQVRRARLAKEAGSGRNTPECAYCHKPIAEEDEPVQLAAGQYLHQECHPEYLEQLNEWRKEARE